MMRECTLMQVKMAPLIITERRIIIYLCSFMGGIIGLHCLGDSWLWGTRLMQITGAAICLMLGLMVLFIWVYLRGRKIAVIGPFIFALFCGAAGFNLAAVQYNLHQSAYLTAPSEVKIIAEIFNIDGWASDRSRLWVKIIETDSDRPQLANARARVTSKNVPTAATIGAVIEMRVRLFPPPRRILPGTTDFGRNARVADIVASGFVTSSIRVLAAPEKPNISLLLGMLRAAQAKDLNDALAKPAGGIAAALIVGDRRFIVEPVYDLFRKSGLAHLLAISGLHMGLLCFGCMAAMRYGAALLPVWANHVAMHKYAAVVAIVIGLIYVCLSGASVSAVRAFMMALLVILAVLIDRRALTMRNVALAGFVILALNPVALFSAGFQLSFAATALLVMAYEKTQHRPMQRRHWLWRYVTGIIIASFLANCATAPFTAQHFGSFTPWGVIANMIGIPLTGFWIMPAALLYMLALPFGASGIIAPVLELGIVMLIHTAEFFAELPFADSAVAPPGYAVLALLVIGVVVGYACTAPWRFAGWGMVGLACLIGSLKPLPDAVIFAQNRSPTLVAASAGGELTIYRRLSAFLIDMAALRLGQHADPEKIQHCNEFCQHQLRRGEAVAIVLKRHGLSAACDDRNTDVIISLATPLYPCRTAKSIYYFTQNMDDNYLLYRDKTGVNYVSSNSGSGQLACLALQPRQC